MNRSAKQLTVRMFMLVTSFFATTVPANSVLCIGEEGHSRIELPHVECCTELAHENLHSKVGHDDDSLTDCGSCVDFYISLDATTRSLSSKIDVDLCSYSAIYLFNAASIHTHFPLLDSNRQRFGIIPKQAHFAILSTVVIRC